MERSSRPTSPRRPWLALALLGWACLAGPAWAQNGEDDPADKAARNGKKEDAAEQAAKDGEKITTLPAPAAVAPGAVVAAPLTLQDCIALAFQKQPALAAAHASLEAAEAGRRGLDNLHNAATLLAPDLPVRRQQACYGVAIAYAALNQAEWETRYAVTRTYYSVQYARMQEGLIETALDRLEKGRKRAERLVEIGDPDVRITKIDVDVIDVNIRLLRTKKTEATSGIQKALGGLREAIGIGPDVPLDVVTEPLPAPVSGLSKEPLIAAALAGRGEIAQASGFLTLVGLEVSAQELARGAKVPTFASGADIHAKPIPQGEANGEYRPGAIGPEMPPTLVGRKAERVARAAALVGRAKAVVDKTANLVALEVDNAFQKWAEAKQKVEQLDPIRERARQVGARVEERFGEGKATGEEYLRTGTLQAQIQAQYNEALYLHMLAVVALERSTAGAYRLQPTAAPAGVRPVAPSK